MLTANWLLPLFGFFVGIIAALTGVGGGIFIVPILAILYGFIPQHAIGTSLTAIIFTALAATYSYAKQKRIYYRTGLLLAITSVPGAYLGAYLTTIISSNVLGLIFGIFLMFVSLRMIFGSHLSQKNRESTRQNSGQNIIEQPLLSDSELVRSGRIIILGVALSFFAGLASGLLGIGGGILAVPIMTLVMGLPIHFATATSMFTMIFTSISGVVKHGLASHIHLIQALFLALGTVLGAQVGAGVSRKIPGGTLARVFGLVLLLVSIQMIVKFI